MDDLLERWKEHLGVGQALFVEFNLDLQKLLGETQRVILHPKFEGRNVLLNRAHCFEDVHEIPCHLVLSVIEGHLVHALALLVGEGFLAEVCHLLVAFEVNGLEIVKLPRQIEDSLCCAGGKLKGARALRFVQFAAFESPQPF